MECGDQPESKRLPLSSDGCLKMRRERKYRGGGQRKWNGGKMGGWENGKCWNHGCLHTHTITLYSHRYLCCGFINNILADDDCMHVCSCIKLITCFPVPLIPYRRTYFLIFYCVFLKPLFLFVLSLFSLSMESKATCLSQCSKPNTLQLQINRQKKRPETKNRVSSSVNFGFCLPVPVLFGLLFYCLWVIYALLVVDSSALLCLTWRSPQPPCSVA